MLKIIVGIIAILNFSRSCFPPEVSLSIIEENRSRSRHNVEGFFCKCTVFRLAKPAFFRYNENFTLVRDFYVAYFVIPEISKKHNNIKITYQCKILIVPEQGWFGQPKYSTPSKKSFYVVSTSASIFFIPYVKPIRSLLIQRTPAGSSFRLFA